MLSVNLGFLIRASSAFEQIDLNYFFSNIVVKLNTIERNFSYIAFFDLDRTILRTSNGTPLVLEAYKRKIMTRRDLISAIRYSILYKLEWKETTKILSEMAAWIEGLDEKKFRDFAQEVVKSKLIDEIRPEVYQEMEMHRKEGAGLVMLSAATIYVCQPIAEHLGMDDVISSELEVKEGVFTGIPAGTINYGDQKLVRFETYCEKNQIDREKAWFYTDSHTDIPVMEEVGYPICVAPDRRLRKHAQQKNWVIKTW